MSAPFLFRNWPIGEDGCLDSIPQVTKTCFEDVTKGSDSDCIIDKVYPNRPLIISFNYFTQSDGFDFLGRLRKLETRVGAPFNRLLLRDRKNLWYQHGITGLGNSVNEVAVELHEIIKLIRPTEVITIGQSMGGYAAILFGLLLHADRAIGFGPLSHLNAEWTERDGDTRWLPILKLLNAHTPHHWYDDLVPLAISQPIRPELHIVTGTNPNGKYGLPNIDKLHADRYATIPGVHSYIYPESQHEVSEWLLEHNQFDELLYQLIVTPSSKNKPTFNLSPPIEGRSRYVSILRSTNI